MQVLPDNQDISKPDFPGVLTQALGHVCELTHWDYGEVWMPNSDGTILQLSPASYINTDQSKVSIFALEQFKLCSQAFILSPGVGLPGRVYLSQQPEWIDDVSVQSETYFLRHYIAKAFGVKTGLGVPIISNDRVLAILVFFMLSVRSQDKQLVELVTAVATWLGTCYSS